MKVAWRKEYATRTRNEGSEMTQFRTFGNWGGGGGVRGGGKGEGAILREKEKKN